LADISQQDVSKTILVAKEILVFDFELLTGGRHDILHNIGTLFAKSNEKDVYTNVTPTVVRQGQPK